MNIALPTMKITNIKTEKPSKPHTKSFRGITSCGCGFGHEDTQSTHEQADRIPCKKKRKNSFWSSRFFTHVIHTHIDRFTAGNNLRIQWDETIDFFCWFLNLVVDLKWYNIFSGITHEVIPIYRWTFCSSPLAAHQIQCQLAGRRKLNVFTWVVSFINVVFSNIEINFTDISFWSRKNIKK